jgi:ABC-type antimicrobial peptide transport system permease subunit
MIKNYLIVAWRYLIKNKAHSFINILGLSVGMAVALLIGLWIHDELSFDKNHSNYDRVARVIQNVTHNGAVQTWNSVPLPLAEELRKHYGSDFKSVVMGRGSSDLIVGFGDKKITQKGAFYEPPITDLLSLHMLKGSRDALKDPSAIILSASGAKALFGDNDPMGKILKLDNSINAKVAGVYEDLPYNSTFSDLRFIAPWQLLYTSTDWIRTMQDPWRPNAFELYVQLTDKANLASASARIRDAKLKMVNPALAAHKPQLFLFPMSQWHLFSEFRNGVNTGGRIQYVWMFGIIGIFVLLLACINFMNLSTARSEKRAPEVGIRKAIGSLRSQLIYQFFSESILVVSLAFIFSLVLAQLSLPFFNGVADKKMAIPWQSFGFWITALSFTLVTGLISGSYPALYLSSFRPVKVLKGSFRVGRLASLPRKALVVLQFTVSVTLIIGTIIVFRQIQYAKDRPIGYDRSGLIAMNMVNSTIHDHFNAVRDELIQKGAIVSLAEGDGSPTRVYSSTSGIEWTGKDPTLAVDMSNASASYDYGRTVGWQFVTGRDFSRDYARDSAGLVLNESAVKFMGFKDPIGQIVKWNGTPLTVIGVIKNMIMESPYDEVSPCMFYLQTTTNSAVIAKLNPRLSAAEALAIIGPVFRKYNPEQPFEYHFVEEEYARKFGNEQRIGTLASFFAALAIFISCLGLFGMSSFMAEQRIKEIGVRKVLGASVFNLWGLLSKDFVALVFVALFIAIPSAYFLMFSWLQNYQYRTELSWWFFALPATGAMLITLLTVSFQSVKAALTNPVKSLRSE